MHNRWACFSMLFLLSTSLGLLIPDLLWILQRILISTTTLDPVQVRAYVVSMSAPFFYLLLSAAISLPFRGNSKMMNIL